MSIIIKSVKSYNEHEIKLDIPTHRYSIEGIDIEPQISVTSLINQSYTLNNEAMKLAMLNGQKIHEDLAVLLSNPTAEEAANHSDQTKLLARYLLSQHKNKDRKMEFEKKLCSALTLEDTVTGGTDTIFLVGSIDCICDNHIWEFKTATKHNKNYEYQVLFYRFLLEAGGRNVAGVHTCTLDGARDFSSVKPAEIKKMLEDKLTKHFLRQESNRVLETDGFDFYNLQLSILNYESVLKELKQKREELINTVAPIEKYGEGKYSIDGVLLKRNKISRTTIDSDLVREKLPEAVKHIEYFSNTFEMESKYE